MINPSDIGRDPIRRVGVLATSPDAVAEMDLKNLFPRSVPFFTGRIYHDIDLPRGNATLDKIVSEIEPAIKTASQVNPELFVFACTSGSFYKGRGWDDEIARRMQVASGVPAIVTTTSVRKALKVFNAKRVFLVTPYIDSVNKAEVDFFGAHGIAMDKVVNFKCERGIDICSIHPRDIFNSVMARQDDVRRCDAILLSCTALRGLEAVEALEERLNLPVVSSNQAAAWEALHRLGVASENPIGRLFSTAPSD